ncbi:uncharacterized protein LOC117641427 isoform X4 [Thrips palmi]|uniref:Uncharacterized protein LOC117641427 isoform X4 n=1 Tax=Thrips palmi TaxID=161013 RepID=A0A6P8YE14_THRPL|nr:uncharacterized protein LOC117641427 isoform X4 [Thrips palmi]
MADTSQAEQPPQTNGFANDGLDEEDREKMRPADIDADVREMERRKRVEMIMNSRLFREELERIFESQMKDGGAGPGGLLQQLSDMMGHGGPRFQTSNMFRSSNCVIPINDIRGLESMGYSKGEKVLRCKLAAVYRLMDLYGWTQGIHNHITARLNQDEEHFLVNPWGMLYHEITASSLAKVDMQGNIVEKGTTNYGVNRDSFQLHSAIHAARPDIKCIIHIHTNSVLAVSSLKCGLIPLCQESCVIGEVSSHQYQGGLFEPEERDKISRNLGPNNKVMFLTNHGAMCCGETVEEAFFNVYNTVQACESQIKLMPMGIDNLVLLTDETRKRVYDAARRPPEGFALDKADKEKDKEVTSPTIAVKGKRWGVGCTEFEALMRMLDNAGFRTGYIYRHPLVKGDPPRPRNDVEVPPAVSSLGYLLEEEEMYRQGGWKKWMEGRKTHDRTRWLNSPNVYQKVEILETGTPDPKKITKWVDANADEWVADGSPTHSSTPVKIDTLQFVPKNTNPKEFKRLQQQIKENRRADKITSGPQSHILEGVSWEEAKKLQDANISQTGDQVILVGAASKGIIQRGFQHNAMVYKAPYAKNPFDTVTDDELEEYKKTVTRKVRGDGYDEDQSESEALSSSAAGRPPTGKSPISDDESRDATPDLVVAPGGFGRSWSLGRNKRQSKDCSSKREMSSALQKTPAALPRPPHFHHAVYASLPCHQSPPKTVSCSITRFSKVNAQVCRKEEVTDTVLLINYPKSQVLHQDILTENVNGEEDGDSLADVISLPSSDFGYLDENHNETIDHSDVEVIKVQLKSLGEVQNSTIMSINDNNMLTSDQVWSLSDKCASDAMSLNTDQECSFLSENGDNTVICTRIGKDSQDVDSKIKLADGLIAKRDDADSDCQGQSLNYRFSAAQAGSLLAPEEQFHSEEPYSEVEESPSIEDNMPLDPPMACLVEDEDMLSVNIHEPYRDIKKASDSKSEEILAMTERQENTIDISCSMFSIPDARDNFVGQDEVDTNNTLTHDQLFASVIEEVGLDQSSKQITESDSSFNLCHSTEGDSNSIAMIPCSSEPSKPYSPSSFVQKVEIEETNDVSESLEPHLTSLAGPYAVLQIGHNEKVDMFSILSVNPVESSSMDSILVEDLIAAKRDNSPTLESTDEQDSNENHLEKSWIPVASDLQYGQKTSEFNSDFLIHEDIQDFHDVSRSNLELLDASCSINSPRPSHLNLTSMARSDISLESRASDEGEQSIPNGAGETLYDPSETCSDEFYSPLSTFCSPAFATDSGEDFYSPYPDAQLNESEPEDDDGMCSTLEESDIEIDCNPFSRSASMPSSPLTNNNLDLERGESDNEVSSLDSTGVYNEDRWPTFIAYPHPIEEGMGAFSSENKVKESDLSRDLDSQDDLSTLYAEDSSHEQSLESEMNGRCALSRLSYSTPNMNSVGTYQSSPLELGRLFTLKNIRSVSETGLNNFF